MAGFVVARSSSGTGPAKLWEQLDERSFRPEVSGRRGDGEFLELRAEEKAQVGNCIVEG